MTYSIVYFKSKAWQQDKNDKNRSCHSSILLRQKIHYLTLDICLQENIFLESMHISWYIRVNNYARDQLIKLFTKNGVTRRRTNSLFTMIVSLVTFQIILASSCIKYILTCKEISSKIKCDMYNRLTVQFTCKLSRYDDPFKMDYSVETCSPSHVNYYCRHKKSVWIKQRCKFRLAWYGRYMIKCHLPHQNAIMIDVLSWVIRTFALKVTIKENSKVKTNRVLPITPLVYCSRHGKTWYSSIQG